MASDICQTLTRRNGKSLSICFRSSHHSLFHHSARAANLATFKIPQVKNEPNKHYGKGSTERVELSKALRKFRQEAPLQIPIFVEGKEQHAGTKHDQPFPMDHQSQIATWSSASQADIRSAIKAAMIQKLTWQRTPFHQRAAIFLKAADLIGGKYRYEIMAATMLGQGKNVWQAEIDAAAELCDFLRFNVQYAQELYAQQPEHNSQGVWNRVEYRPLEGFVYAITPFNFTAIAGNLPAAPALMGNVVIWKPSPAAMASNWILYKILLEAGLPPNVIQFVPGDAVEVTKEILADENFAALHYTGSTDVFRQLYGQISTGVVDGKYKGYPRIVGETGGKNFHLVHPSADLKNAVINTVRGAFEYQGQKCSATSRAYFPKSQWESCRKMLIEETSKLKIGSPEDIENFIGPVIHQASFDKLSKAIDAGNTDSDLKLLVGGRYDGGKGWYIHPTIYESTKVDHELMSKELFGPILCIYVYDDTQDCEAAFESMFQIIDESSKYALTGAVFAKDRDVIQRAEEALQNSAGNFYINCKSTGAVVGQQPFGGARASGTNDKAGSASLLSRFVSMRSIKESFADEKKVGYPSNEI